MIKEVEVIKNKYYDSVTLMSLSSKITSTDGVQQAVVLMGTDMNISLIKNAGLWSEKLVTVTPNDLIIAIQAENEEILNNCRELIDTELTSKTRITKKSKSVASSLDSALNILPEANLSIISVPGEYAAREAKKSLEKGLNVLIFSDNVDIQDEITLKKMGKEKGLLVMGPDCGTAIINNKGLCFANSVRKGSIGLIAASGTGLQEVTVQIDRLGYGISQAIGIGGRDLSEEVGGIMMLESLDLLEKDPSTEVIALISKPPSGVVFERIKNKLKEISKPVIVCFLDSEDKELSDSNITYSSTLEEAAVLAVKKLNPFINGETSINEEVLRWIKGEVIQKTSEQKFIRGLFCGGTLTSEALYILREKGNVVRSNVAKKQSEILKDVFNSEYNTLLDMGEDVFTNGKPHPMIEPSLRNKRIIQEAKDPETSVLLLDFEIGYGAHNNPVGESLGTIKEAMKIAQNENRKLSVVAYILGTETDIQDINSQKQMLESIGVYVASSNKQAVQIAHSIIAKEVV